jgi:hypothetical protein
MHGANRRLLRIWSRLTEHQSYHPRAMRDIEWWREGPARPGRPGGHPEAGGSVL